MKIITLEKMHKLKNEIDDAPLDGLNDGSIKLKDGKFISRTWCKLCRGDTDQHFCECGDEIQAETCKNLGGFCADCYFLFHL